MLDKAALQQVVFVFSSVSPHNHHLSPPRQACDSSYQAAHYHILGLYIGGFYSVPALGWLQNTRKEVGSGLMPSPVRSHILVLCMEGSD
jgi:hypothetical protein